MKTELILTSGDILTINSTNTGAKASKWGADKHQHHTVGLSLNGKRTRFDFWASKAQPTMKTDNDNLGALQCFFSDALSGENSFSDFCGEFGYDIDSRQAEKTFKACQRAYDKALRFFGSSDVICDILNEQLSEI